MKVKFIECNEQFPIQIGTSSGIHNFTIDGAIELSQQLNDSIYAYFLNIKSKDKVK